MDLAGGRTAMPVSSDELPRRQQDRARRDGRPLPDEPRNLDAASHDPATPHGAYAGFDADLNPIDDETVNTHGSER
jgi:hypothetical protein